MNLLLKFQVCVWAAALFNALVAVLILHRWSRSSAAGDARPTRLLRRLVVVAIVVGALAVPEFALARPVGGLFGWIQLAYVFIAVIPPCVGLWVLSQLRRRAGPRAGSRWSIAMIGLTLLAPAPICVYASFVAPFRLVVERATVPMPVDARITKPIRIGVLADLQTDIAGDHERAAIDRLLAEKPDLIVMPGDFFQIPEDGWNARYASFVELLRRIRAPHGVYAVLGDVDWPLASARRLLADSGITLLENSIEVVTIGDTRIALGGIELEYDSPAAVATIRRLRAADADSHILIAHRPDAALIARPDDRIDLVIAGHTHGGQVVVPGFGPLMTLTRVPRYVAAGGLHTVDGQRIYVSRGVGYERMHAPPVRFFCPPEVSVLELGALR